MEQTQLLINPQTILMPPPFPIESISPKKPNLDAGTFVRRARTQDDFLKVFDLRWEGYKKYFKSKDEIVDELDFSQNCTLLLAEDEYHNAIGTLRILDRRFGTVELDKYVELGQRGPCHKSAR